MTLEKHVIDTMKEWQIKIGSLDSDVRLYYPKTSLCAYLNLDINIDSGVLSRYIEKYFAENVKCLGDVTVSENKDRFCIMVGKKGCNYVEQSVLVPEFLAEFLEALKCQKIQSIYELFERYAEKYGTRVCVEKGEEELETTLWFEDESVEPYVYCINENEFGITYHRFTRGDYSDL